MQIENLNNYSMLLDSIGNVIQNSKNEINSFVSKVLINTYWEIGKHIVKYEQKGSEKAEYGTFLLTKLSKDLKARYGKGFSRTTVKYIRLFYLKFPIGQTSDQLTWSHYVELLSISDVLEREFFFNETINQKWSVRELRRQKDSALFHRLALSKDKKGVLELARKGQIIQKNEDILKEPYILEFLNISENTKLSEKSFESKIISKLQDFIMELGKGFTFVARQFRITLANKHYYVDLVFYHRILKCFVLIDLKIKGVTHYDIGQMNMYLNYFKTEENVDDDNEPLGIILAKEKDNIMVEYALGGISNKLFVSKYQLYLPEKAVLINKLQNLLS